MMATKPIKWRTTKVAAQVSASGRRSRTKHWERLREQEKANMRALIADAIAGMKSFPTPAEVLKASNGTFSRSSVSRHIDLVDSAQAAFNEFLTGRGEPPRRTRLESIGRPSATDALEKERARRREGNVLLDMAEVRIADLEAVADAKQTTIDGLLKLVAALHSGKPIDEIIKRLGGQVPPEDERSDS